MPSLDSGDDLVWVFGPDEGFWVLIVLCNEAVDSRLEVRHGPEDAALEPALAELGKEALHRVEPGTGRRREVEYPARMPREPGQHLGMFVGCVIVEDDVDDFAGRNLSLDGI